MTMNMENCRIRKAISGNTDPARTGMSSPLLLVFIILLKLQILSFQCLQHLKILQRICNRSTEHFKIELTLTFTNVAQKHSVSILWSFKRARSRFGDG